MTPTAADYFAQGEADESAGKIEAALAAYQHALNLDANHRQAQEKLAIFTVANNPQRAIALARALGMRTGDRDILAHLGYVSFCAWAYHRRRDEALAAIRFWLSVQPSDKDHLIEAGDFAAAQGEPALAVDVYARCFAAHPGSLLALRGWVSQLLRAGRPVEAKKLMESVIQKAPQQPALQQIIGNCYAALGEHRNAESAWRRAVELAPSDLGPLSSLMYSSLARDDLDAAALLANARGFGAAVSRLPPPADIATWRALADPPSPGRRLRVGLSSADLRLHPVAFFLAKFFTHHDRQRIELIVLADSHADDPLVRQLRSQAAAWHDTTDLAPAAYGRFVRDLALDVLIDLAGHTSGHRLIEFSWRLARRQATYLGYAGTTGGPALDARFADADTEPESAAAYSSEPIIRLEGSYFCFSPYSIGGEAALGESPAANGNRFSFGCCTQHGKITPSTVRLWTGVLRARPDARMIVRCREFAEQTVRDEFARLWKRQGGNPGQLETGGWRMGGDHFRIYDDIDIVLNTYPFHLATNLCDALWMGVPVISLLGPNHRSRMGLSICRAAGHAEWCAEDESRFIDLALSLANDLPTLLTLRREMREQVRRSALFDGPSFARRMEAALLALVAT